MHWRVGFSLHYNNGVCTIRDVHPQTVARYVIGVFRTDIHMSYQ